MNTPNEKAMARNEQATAPISWIIHIDMDAFFASVEQLDAPELRGKPVIVGVGARGVVCAASYEARVFGVRSGTPVPVAQRLCPQGIFLPGRRARYVELSRRVMESLSVFSPLVEPASIDEAYVDAAGLERLFGSIENIGHRMKEAVYEATGGLTCSVGASTVKFLAKIASDMQKPNGLSVIYPQDVPAFLLTLPVERIPGVGKKFAADLRTISVRTGADVQRLPEEFWQRRFGKAGVQLWHRAHGNDTRTVTALAPPKSESAENTLESDTWDMEILTRALLAQAERVGASLRQQKLRGRTMTLKIKYTDFQQITRSRTLPQNTNTTQDIFSTACALLQENPLPKAVRLIGLSVSGFEERNTTTQGLLPSRERMEAEEARAQHAAKHAALDATLDTLRQRFGRDAVVRGRLFTEK